MMAVFPEGAGQVIEGPVDIPYQALRGVTTRRILAYCADLLVIFLILVILHWVAFLAFLVSFGLLWPLSFMIVPSLVALAYHAFQIGGPKAATLGMRMFGLSVHNILGGRPTLGQALIHTICFYGTVSLSAGFLLLFALFNEKRRTVHDFLAGTIVLCGQH